MVRRVRARDGANSPARRIRAQNKAVAAGDSPLVHRSVWSTFRNQVESRTVDILSLNDPHIHRHFLPIVIQLLAPHLEPHSRLIEP